MQFRLEQIFAWSVKARQLEIDFFVQLKSRVSKKVVCVSCEILKESNIVERNTMVIHYLTEALLLNGYEINRNQLVNHPRRAFGVSKIFHR